ncbi:MAG: proton-conducting transporter membrane subunit [Bacillota bacterium]|nr:proton-conducting transporter membrane subunit [Bacillota bacterium]MDW7683110.1 proton-conducting transporter membrane subunit [Bacillota bacterium]
MQEICSPHLTRAVQSALPLYPIILPAAGVIIYGLVNRYRTQGWDLTGGYREKPSGFSWLDSFLIVGVYAVLWVIFVMLSRTTSIATHAPLQQHGSTSEVQSIIPLVMVLLPMVGAVVCGVVGRFNQSLRDYVATSVSLMVFALALSLYPLVKAGVVTYTLPGFIGLGLAFRVDFLGFVFASLASLIWYLATFYSGEYMHHENAPTRYFVFLLLSLGGCVGVFLAADFLSLFLFFEAMTVLSYALVVHKQSEDAMAAGRNYLYMGIFGGLCLLTAIMILYSHTGTIAIAANLEHLADMGASWYLMALLFFIGFGIKAGAAPLHIWLPQAHPVAPTPASALLSGIMIKTGAYGIIRVFNLLMTPHDGHSSLWELTGQMGQVIIWIGTITMFMAAILALSQSHAKKVLAYSSVSQMGYILMGIGAAAYLGYEGAMGFAGLSYHIVNHAFFKAGMFLMVGAVYLRTHDLNYSKLGGLWRSFPVTAFSFLIAGAAISGIPGFNGYVSKTLLHHAIVEAAAHHGSMPLWFAEKIFVVTGGLTFCYILRLFSATFLGPDKPGRLKYEEETLLEKLIFGAFATFILIGGMAPMRVIENVIIPMSNSFHYDQYAVKHLMDLNFWSKKDLGGIAVSLGIGAVFFAIMYYRKFVLPLPGKLSVEHLVYKPILNGMLFTYTLVGRLLENFVEILLVGTVIPLSAAARIMGRFDVNTLPLAGGLVRQGAVRLRDSLYDYVLHSVEQAAVYTRRAEWVTFFTMIKMDYNPRGEHLYKKLTLMNLDLCLFIVIVMLVIIFSMRYLTLSF